MAPGVRLARFKDLGSTQQTEIGVLSGLARKALADLQSIGPDQLTTDKIVDQRHSTKIRDPFFALPVALSRT